MLIFGCSAARENLVADSDMAHVDAFWDLQGQSSFLPGLGPEGRGLIYIRGKGGPSGFRSSASFFAPVAPGQTYTFSAYVDATGHQGTPPYVVLRAVDGSWSGALVYQGGKGRVSTTFSLPANCGTTLIRGTFTTENGSYPIGRGAQFAEPQLEQGSSAHDYVPGDGAALGRPPPDGNLVVDSDLDHPQQYWELTGRMRIRTADGMTGVEYAGDGRPAGYNDTASFFATVHPGNTYTFSMFMDALAHQGSPAYVFLTAYDGSWQGTALYQAGRGRVFTTFSIPRSSRTTLVRATVSPQNGTYRLGDHFFAAQPQLAVGALPAAYEAGSDSHIAPPPGGNLVIDSDMKSIARTWQLTGRMHAVANPTDGRRVIAYSGDGRPSGFSSTARFFARVIPGGIYTFSAFVDGSAHAGTPPYVFLNAVNGKWAGAYEYQPGSGRIFLTFTIPRESATSCISGTVSPQNGAYAAGTAMLFSQPQIAAGPPLTKYVAGPPLTEYVAGPSTTGGCG